VHRWVAVAFVGAMLLALAPPAAAQEDGCRRAVILTLPGVTWHDVERWSPPNVLAAVEEGAAGSVAVRTNSSLTTYASGFTTIGAGSRMDATVSMAQAEDLGFLPTPVIPGEPEDRGKAWRVPGVDDINELAKIQGYSTSRAGSLGSSLGRGGLIAIGASGFGPEAGPAGVVHHSLLAVMDREGEALGIVGDELVTPDADAPFGVRTDPVAFEQALEVELEGRCASAIIDQGDLTRADAAAENAGDPLDDVRRDALLAADVALGTVQKHLDEDDLLLIVSPTSPSWDDDTHFGIAVAVGPGFEAGTTLVSASTRRDGIVTLPDVAPTVLEHLGIERPASMLGRAWFDISASGDPVAGALDLDDEAVFIDGVRTPVSTVFVLAQVALYAVTIWVLRRRDIQGRLPRRKWLETAGLALAAFPLSTYLVGVIQGHPLGPWLYGVLLVAIDAALVALVIWLLDEPLERLLGVVGVTFVMLIVDLMIGAPLQLNTVFSYSPIVAGRFAGIGNIGFAILAATSVLTGALVVHRFGDAPKILAAAAAIFAVTIVVDGAPQWGSDVGGALALVPGLALAWFLIAGRKLNARLVVAALAAGVVVLAGFLALDLSRPPDERTHLGRLYEDVRSQGFEVFNDTIKRKVRTNLRVFRSTIWTFVVPPALALLAALLFFPRGRWEAVARTHPRVRAGLIAGAILAILGFAVNDSGIVIPAMMCAYLVPVALLVHLSIDRGEREAPA